MSSPSPLAKLALRKLADEPVDVEAPSVRDVDDAVAAIASELEAIRRRRKVRIAAFATLSVAAIVSLGIGFALRGGSTPSSTRASDAVVDEVTGSVVVMRGNHGTAVARGETIGRGDRILASSQASASLTLRTGTELRAEDGADVVVAEHGSVEMLDLRAGSVRLRVAKLSAGERFVVRTLDAEVEVRGTSFRVEVAGPCEGTTTRVSVSEGVVAVRHAGAEVNVGAGQSWPRGCTREAQAAPAAASAPASQPLAVAPGTERAPSPPATSTHVAAATVAKPLPMTSSELAEQNRLFAEAMAAKKRGDTNAAVGALDRLTVTHPNGPLAETAQVERMRILAAADPARAADAARVYLARYPHGHARDEARRIAGLP